MSAGFLAKARCLMVTLLNLPTPIGEIQSATPRVATGWPGTLKGMIMLVRRTNNGLGTTKLSHAIPTIYSEVIPIVPSHFSTN